MNEEKDSHRNSPLRFSIPRPPAIGFVARRDEQGRDIVELLKNDLTSGRYRLVTLWGPGGVGKTTLAAEAVRALHSTFRERLAWVNALSRSDFSLSALLDDIAFQLGDPVLRTLAPAYKEEQVRTLISASPTVVILDNFETVAPEEQARCAKFLIGCADCSALITTRVMMAEAHNLRLDAMSMQEAHEFLRILIREADEPLAFADLDRDELIKSCEGNPLIMQWVVRQIKLAQRPQDVLSDLVQGRGDAAGRVFDRSFNLPQLGDDGRSALLALSLFAPDASRVALSAVAGFGDDLQRLNKAVANLSSLRLVETSEGNARLLLSALTRQLARNRLEKDARVGEFHHRFAAYFLRYAETHGHMTAENFNELGADKDNLLSALNLAFARQDWQSVIRFRFALGEFLDLRGYWVEAVNTGEQALQAARLVKDELSIAVLSHNLAVTYQNRGELSAARHLYSDSLEIANRLGDQRGVAQTLHQLAVLAQGAGEEEEARRLYGESLEIKKRLGDQRGVASTLHQLAVLAHDAGEVETARRLYGESLEIDKKFGNQSGVAISLHQLGVLAQAMGDLVEARRLYGESLEIKKRLGDQRGVAQTLHNLAAIAQAIGDLVEARRLYGESLEIKKRLGDQSGVASTLNGLGLMAELEGDKIEAARLFREALNILERLRSPNAEIVRRNSERVEHQSA